MKKILLGLLPYWTPLIPPMGIASLKGYLEEHGFEVYTFDANIEDIFKNLYNEYFINIKKWIPKKKTGNLFNIGHDVLQYHLMIRFNLTDKTDYNESVRVILQNNYYFNVNDKLIVQLNNIVERFYTSLEIYLLEITDKINPDVVGLSAHRGTLPATLFSFKLIKKQFNDIKTIIGGPIFSQELTVNSPNFNYLLDTADYIDKIIMGEGEGLFLSYLQEELPKTQRTFSINDIGNKTIDINHAPLPKFNKKDLKYYMYLPSYASRSCPYNCSFCAETLNWGAFRKKKTENIINDFVALQKQYNSQLFFFVDSLINPFINDLSLQLFQSDYCFYFDGYLKIDKHTCNYVNSEIWRKGGFYRARIGVESGSQNVLNLMDKKITVSQIRQTIKNLSSTGIKPSLYFIIGHPGETEIDFQQTLDLIDELKDDIYEAECNPFRFFWSGQNASDSWDSQFNKSPLYPEFMTDLLFFKTYQLDNDPKREVIYDRVCRFVEHCKNLGIPNPYTFEDVYKADNRWQDLHKNAVPNIVDFKSNIVTECKYQ
jgi:radical SAM superfamily enzyme YgiQ (UPF0313 family)